jgi:saccharopine dehydrogenase-like NADP-dependent oxidoreductase
MSSALEASFFACRCNIAQKVIDILVKKDDINLTLFLRNKNRSGNKDVSKCRIIEGDVLDFDQLKDAIEGQDIVYANLAGKLEAMAKNIVRAMGETGVKSLYLSDPLVS